MEMINIECKVGCLLRGGPELVLQRLVLVLDAAELEPEPRVLRLRLLPQLQQVIVDHRQLPQQSISAQLVFCH